MSANACLLSPEDVAKRCGLSRKAVYRAIDRGELKASRLCSRLRIREEDMESWIEANRVELSGPAAGRQRRVSLRSAGGLRGLLTENSRISSA